ncbi:deoxyribonuclease-1-like [Osmerus eperlanus]|uniref:deoxyribonuclease-1-like n=1 Tax=Osmerus eperlanus TaxID=29151 RepID=UPI002E0D746C
MKIASFNIQKLGLNKVANKDVLSYIIKIVSRYSVILILEVVDRSGKAMRTFLEELNSKQDNRKHPYTMAQSSRLGRDSYKEQFVFLYREDQVRLTDSYQYEDDQAGDEDAFAREPYILRFTCLSTVLSDLVLIPVHTQPTDSQKELDELYDVVEVVREKWETDNILILGDFNADGRYVSRSGMRDIRIRSDANYHWLIADDVDTTASTANDHTYDRIVVYGDNMMAAIVPNSAKPFNYQQEFHLSTDIALSISDHYPVEVELKKKQMSGQEAKKKRSQTPQRKKTVPKAQKKMVAGPEKKEDVQKPQKKTVSKTRKIVAGLKKKEEVQEPQKKRVGACSLTQRAAKRKK